MSSYRRAGHVHYAIIADKRVLVDSDTEERFLRYLEEHGFHDRWIKPVSGGQKGRHRYTPDVELSVEERGMTHRAIVEVKPDLRFFTRDVSRRLRGVAPYYLTTVLYVFTDKDQQWYRLDRRTGRLRYADTPVPGFIPIKKLYKSPSVAAPRVYGHRYRRSMASVLMQFMIDTSRELLIAPFKVPRRRRRR